MFPFYDLMKFETQHLTDTTKIIQYQNSAFESRSRNFSQECPARFPEVLFSFHPVAQSRPTLCDPTDCSTPGLPVHHQPQSLLKLMSIESVMPSNHLILCHPLLLLPPIPPSIRVFSDESVLHIRWLKYWSFSFSISPSNEHPGLISFRMDW